jgi:hypothetical protein
MAESTRKAIVLARAACRGYRQLSLKKETAIARKSKQPRPQRQPIRSKEKPSLIRTNWTAFKLLLSKPVSGASLAAFRIALGLVMSLEAYALVRPNPAALTTGTTPLETYYTGSDIRFHFPYEGFEWLPLLPPQWIHWLVALQALAGVTMALGLGYRLSAATVFLSWGYLWLVESTRTYWQSHYYLECLLTFLMIWMPAARRYSVDAWIARGRNRPSTVPYWTLLLLRGQLLIAYFYAGVAKLNIDWLRDAMPVRWFIAQPHVTAPYEPYLTAAQIEFFKRILHSPEFAYFLSYAGLVFDLAVGFLLLIRRTRIFALVLMVLFHGINHFLIFDDIGWFPLVGITTAFIFLEPDWPERFWNWLRRPGLKKPDWNWLVPGAILFPMVGAALGWKLQATESPLKPQERHLLGRWTVGFVVAWLAWQTLLPIRHYFIPGDSRFTYEGLSFSWRLKSEARRAFAVQLFVDDPAIISRDSMGRAQIHWNQWHGDKVLYRRVTPGRIDWRLLPEIVPVVEAKTGERVLYNPFAANIKTEADARQRVSRIWQELYGRQPQGVRRTVPLPQILDSISEGLRVGGRGQAAAKVDDLLLRMTPRGQNEPAAGEAMKIRTDLGVVLNELTAREGKETVIAFLRAMDPFTLEGEPSLAAPFLLIEDSLLFKESHESPGHLNPSAWRQSASTRSERRPGESSADGEPLIIYMGELGPEARHALPQACIFDSQDRPQQAAYIWWNSLKDLTVSKFMHMSYQAFYLRRYARRVATLWEKEYGRRPSVQASTAVSLNGRPHQPLVDPTVDLASVPVTRFGHNYWIKNLETRRIPREALVEPPTL